MKKRGLSAVVTTVIIVLLVIVAITIVWSFVKPVIEDAGAEASVLSKRGGLKLKSAEAISPGRVDVVIERGNSNADITDIGVFISSSSGETNVATIGEILNSLESNSYSITHTLSDVVRVGVYPIYDIGGGREGNIEDERVVDSSLVSGLILYYDFESVSGNVVTDKSGNPSRDGIITGNPIIVNGLGGTSSALEFDGNNYIGIGGGNFPEMTPNGDYTISLWFNSGRNQGDTNIDMAFANTINPGVYRTAMYYNHNLGEFGALFHDGTTTYRTSGPVSVNTDYNVVMVHENGNIIKIYINGVLGTGNVQHTSQSANGATIGVASNKNDNKWVGVIDEVKIWDKALSEGDVIKLYNL
jgi:hypothetical protein